jgi:hypothetical protein
MTAGAAVQKYMMGLENEQEILMHLADMMIQTYASESVYLRARKLIDTRGAEASQIPSLIAQTFIYDASDRIAVSGRNVINAMSAGDEQRMLLMGIKRFTKVEPFNTIAARRTIAGTLIEAGKYNL